MATITVKVNSRGVENKLKKLGTQLGPKVAQDTFSAAQYARNVARQLVPVDTAETHNAIAVIVKTQDKKGAVAVMGMRHPVHVNRRWHGAWFNLPRWMTYSRKALSHKWKGGDPRFMIIAKELAFEKFKKDIRIDVKGLVK